MKKRVLLLAAIVALIAGAGIAYAAGSGGGLPGGEPAVWGGGHFYFTQYDVTRDFSIVATPDGGKWIYGIDGSGPRIVGAVKCMRVSGNNAVIGGIIREAPYSPENVGLTFLWYVTDNGMLGATALDQTSAGYVSPESEGFGGTTKYFPYVCPPFSAKPGDTPMYDLTGGDIVVQNATQNQNQQ
jgi:hypothetical protein